MRSGIEDCLVVWHCLVSADGQAHQISDQSGDGDKTAPANGRLENVVPWPHDKF